VQSPVTAWAGARCAVLTNHQIQYFHEELTFMQISKNNTPMSGQERKVRARLRKHKKRQVALSTSILLHLLTFPAECEQNGLDEWLARLLDQIQALTSSIETAARFIRRAPADLRDSDVTISDHLRFMSLVKTLSDRIKAALDQIVSEAIEAEKVLGRGPSNSLDSDK
jgi:hypothetical protein